MNHTEYTRQIFVFDDSDTVEDLAAWASTIADNTTIPQLLERLRNIPDLGAGDLVVGRKDENSGAVYFTRYEANRTVLFNNEPKDEGPSIIDVDDIPKGEDVEVKETATFEERREQDLKMHLLSIFADTEKAQQAYEWIGGSNA